MEVAMNKSRLMLWTLAGVLTFAMIGCATGGAKLSDADIAESIKGQLEAPSGPDGPFAVDIFVTKGEVTLDGKVPDATAKEQSIGIAQSNEGVKAVKSFLIVP